RCANTRERNVCQAAHLFAVTPYHVRRAVASRLIVGVPSVVLYQDAMRRFFPETVPVPDSCPPYTVRPPRSRATQPLRGGGAERLVRVVEHIVRFVVGRFARQNIEPPLSRPS